MGTLDTELEKSPEAIRQMFESVAPRYDLLNHLLSAFQDVRWRRRASRSLGLPSSARALDLCCGTGDQALSLQARGLQATSADFCLPMLALAKGKAVSRTGRSWRGLAADTLVLPFADRSFDGVTVSFGLRNVADLDRALGEIARVLRAGGRLAVLEFAQPPGPLLGRLYRYYFHRILPRLGAWISPRGSAYRYLPLSVDGFPQRRGLLDRLEMAGFDEGQWKDLTGGIVCLYNATKAS